MRLLGTLEVGGEEEHLNFMLRRTDFKGSDVRLETGELLDGARQPIPYPAIVWDWRCVQSYAWRQTQHINVLELLAFFNYLKRLCMNPKVHATRILHVLDSQVSACVVAKGRSSSHVLNRVLKRVGALSVASDVYVFPYGRFQVGFFRTPVVGPGLAQKESHNAARPQQTSDAHKENTS